MDHFDINEDFVNISAKGSVIVMNIQTVFMCLASLLNKRKNKQFRNSKIFVISWDEFEQNLNFDLICSIITMKIFILIYFDSDKFCCLYIDQKYDKVATYINPNTDKNLPDNIKNIFLNKCGINIIDIITSKFNDKDNSGLYLIYSIDQISLKKKIDPDESLSYIKILCRNYLPAKYDIENWFEESSSIFLQKNNEILKKESDDDIQIPGDKNIDFMDVKSTMDLDQRTKESHPKKKRSRESLNQNETKKSNRRKSGNVIPKKLKTNNGHSTTSTNDTVKDSDITVDSQKETKTKDRRKSSGNLKSNQKVQTINNGHSTTSMDVTVNPSEITVDLLRDTNQPLNVKSVWFVLCLLLNLPFLYHFHLGMIINVNLDSVDDLDRYYYDFICQKKDIQIIILINYNSINFSAIYINKEIDGKRNAKYFHLKGKQLTRNIKEGLEKCNINITSNELYNADVNDNGIYIIYLLLYSTNGAQSYAQKTGLELRKEFQKKINGFYRFDEKNIEDWYIFFIGKYAPRGAIAAYEEIKIAPDSAVKKTKQKKKSSRSREQLQTDGTDTKVQTIKQITKSSSREKMKTNSDTQVQTMKQKTKIISREKMKTNSDTQVQTMKQKTSCRSREQLQTDPDTEVQTMKQKTSSSSREKMKPDPDTEVQTMEQKTSSSSREKMKPDPDTEVQTMKQKTSSSSREKMKPDPDTEVQTMKQKTSSSSREQLKANVVKVLNEPSYYKKTFFINDIYFNPDGVFFTLAYYIDKSNSETYETCKILLFDWNIMKDMSASYYKYINEKKNFRIIILMYYDNNYYSCIYIDPEIKNKRIARYFYFKNGREMNFYMKTNLQRINITIELYAYNQLDVLNSDVYIIFILLTLVKGLWYTTLKILPAKQLRIQFSQVTSENRNIQNLYGILTHKFSPEELFDPDYLYKKNPEEKKIEKLDDLESDDNSKLLEKTPEKKVKEKFVTNDDLLKNLQNFFQKKNVKPQGDMIEEEQQPNEQIKMAEKNSQRDNELEVDINKKKKNELENIRKSKRKYSSSPEDIEDEQEYSDIFHETEKNKLKRNKKTPILNDFDIKQEEQEDLFTDTRDDSLSRLEVKNTIDELISTIEKKGTSKSQEKKKGSNSSKKKSGSLREQKIIEQKLVKTQDRIDTLSSKIEVLNNSQDQKKKPDRKSDEIIKNYEREIEKLQKAQKELEKRYTNLIITRRKEKNDAELNLKSMMNVTRRDIENKIRNSPSSTDNYERIFNEPDEIEKDLLEQQKLRNRISLIQNQQDKYKHSKELMLKDLEDKIVQLKDETGKEDEKQILIEEKEAIQAEMESELSEYAKIIEILQEREKSIAEITEIQKTYQSKLQEFNDQKTELEKKLKSKTKELKKQIEALEKEHNIAQEKKEGDITAALSSYNFMKNQKEQNEKEFFEKFKQLQDERQLEKQTMLERNNMYQEEINSIKIERESYKKDKAKEIDKLKQNISELGNQNDQEKKELENKIESIYSQAKERLEELNREKDSISSQRKEDISVRDHKIQQNENNMQKIAEEKYQIEQEARKKIHEYEEHIQQLLTQQKQEQHFYETEKKQLEEQLNQHVLGLQKNIELERTKQQQQLNELLHQRMYLEQELAQQAEILNEKLNNEQMQQEFVSKILQEKDQLFVQKEREYNDTIRALQQQRADNGNTTPTVFRTESISYSRMLPSSKNTKKPASRQRTASKILIKTKKPKELPIIKEDEEENVEVQPRRSSRLQKQSIIKPMQMPVALELKTNTRKLRSQGPAQEFMELPNKAPSRKRKKDPVPNVDSTGTEREGEIREELSNDAEALRVLKETDEENLNKIKELQEKITALEHEKIATEPDLQNEVQQKKIQIKILEGEIKALKNTNGSQDKKLQKYLKDFETLKKQYQESKERKARILSEYEEQLQELENDLILEKRKVVDAVKQGIEMVNRVDELTEVRKELEIKITELESLKQQYEHVMNKNKQQIELMQKELEQLKQIKNKDEEQKEQIKELEQKIAQEKDNKKNVTITFTQEIAKLKKQVEEKNELLQNIEETVREETIEGLKDEYVKAFETERQKRAASKQTAIANELQKQKEQFDKKIQEYVHREQQFQNEMQRLQAMIQSVVQEKDEHINKYAIELQNLQQINTAMRQEGGNEINELQKMIQQLQASKERRKNQLDQTALHYETQIQGLQNEIITLRSNGQHHHHADQQIQLLQAHFQEKEKQYNQKIQEYNAEIKQLRSKIEQLTEQSSQGNGYDILESQKKEEIETMKQQYDEVIAGLNMELSEVQTAEDLLKRKYKTLKENQTKSEISKAKHIEKEKKYKEKVEMYEEQMRNKGSKETSGDTRITEELKKRLQDQESEITELKNRLKKKEDELKIDQKSRFRARSLLDPDNKKEVIELESKIGQQEQTNIEILQQKDAEISKLTESIKQLNKEFNKYKQEQKRNPTFVHDTTNTKEQEYKTHIEELKKELIREKAEKKETEKESTTKIDALKMELEKLRKSVSNTEHGNKSKLKKRKALDDIIDEGEGRDRSRLNEKENEILRLQKLLENKEKEHDELEKFIAHQDKTIDDHRNKYIEEIEKTYDKLDEKSREKNKYKDELMKLREEIKKTPEEKGKKKRKKSNEPEENENKSTEEQKQLFQREINAKEAEILRLEQKLDKTEKKLQEIEKSKLKPPEQTIEEMKIEMAKKEQTMRKQLLDQEEQILILKNMYRDEKKEFSTFQKQQQGNMDDEEAKKTVLKYQSDLSELKHALEREKLAKEQRIYDSEKMINAMKEELKQAKNNLSKKTDRAKEDEKDQMIENLKQQLNELKSTIQQKSKEKNRYKISLDEIEQEKNINARMMAKEFKTEENFFKKETEDENKEYFKQLHVMQNEIDNYKEREKEFIKLIEEKKEHIDMSIKARKELQKTNEMLEKNLKKKQDAFNENIELSNEYYQLVDQESSKNQSDIKSLSKQLQWQLGKNQYYFEEIMNLENTIEEQKKQLAFFLGNQKEENPSEREVFERMKKHAEMYENIRREFEEYKNATERGILQITNSAEMGDLNRSSDRIISRLNKLKEAEHGINITLQSELEKITEEKRQELENFKKQLGQFHAKIQIMEKEKEGLNKEFLKKVQQEEENKDKIVQLEIIKERMEQEKKQQILELELKIENLLFEKEARDEELMNVQTGYQQEEKEYKQSQEEYHKREEQLKKEIERYKQEALHHQQQYEEANKTLKQNVYRQGDYEKEAKVLRDTEKQIYLKKEADLKKELENLKLKNQKVTDDYNEKKKILEDQLHKRKKEYEQDENKLKEKYAEKIRYKSDEIKEKYKREEYKLKQRYEEKIREKSNEKKEDYEKEKRKLKQKYEDKLRDRSNEKIEDYEREKKNLKRKYAQQLIDKSNEKKQDYEREKKNLKQKYDNKLRDKSYDIKEEFEKKADALKQKYVQTLKEKSNQKNTLNDSKNRKLTEEIDKLKQEREKIKRDLDSQENQYKQKIQLLEQREEKYKQDIEGLFQKRDRTRHKEEQRKEYENQRLHLLEQKIDELHKNKQQHGEHSRRYINTEHSSEDLLETSSNDRYSLPTSTELLRTIQNTRSYKFPDKDFDAFVTELLKEIQQQKKYEKYNFKEALSALRVTAEDFLLELFKRATEYADNEHRVTVMPKDLERANDELQ